MSYAVSSSGPSWTTYDIKTFFPRNFSHWTSNCDPGSQYIQQTDAYKMFSIQSLSFYQFYLLILWQQLIVSANSFLDQNAIKGVYISQWPQSLLLLMILYRCSIKYATIFHERTVNEKSRRFWHKFAVLFFENKIIMTH